MREVSRNRVRKEGGSGEKHDDLADLLQGADRVAGLAADLAQAERAEAPEDDGKQDQRGDKRAGSPSDQQREQRRARRDDRRFRRAPAGACRQAVGARRRRQCMKAGISAREAAWAATRRRAACRHCRGRRARSSGPAPTAPARGAEGADAAVAHDLELAFARLAAAESVGNVGQAILVQAAGDEHASRPARGRPPAWRGSPATAAARHARRRSARPATRRSARPIAPAPACRSGAIATAAGCG